MAADSAKPTDTPLLDQMSARIWDAAISRTVGNAAGMHFARIVIGMVVLNSRPSLVPPVADRPGDGGQATLKGASDDLWKIRDACDGRLDSAV
ncbi:hypothetical protein ABZ135_38215 [Streptomyces sp. NPDC006339]|uniref:hypothetical protein n=1 Tax=Streptomyces sp. NPDC006339 TaxID=3156755 RepID=UPI0033B844CE